MSAAHPRLPDHRKYDRSATSACTTSRKSRRAGPLPPWVQKPLSMMNQHTSAHASVPIWRCHLARGSLYATGNQTSALIIESVLLGDNIDKGAKRRRHQVTGRRHRRAISWEGQAHNLCAPCLSPRAFSVPIESERSSISLFGRIFATQTGVHFTGKCSSCPAHRVPWGSVPWRPTAPNPLKASPRRRLERMRWCRARETRYEPMHRGASR